VTFRRVAGGGGKKRGFQTKSRTRYEIATIIEERGSATINLSVSIKRENDDCQKKINKLAKKRLAKL